MNFIFIVSCILHWHGRSQNSIKVYIGIDTEQSLSNPTCIYTNVIALYIRTVTEEVHYPFSLSLVHSLNQTSKLVGQQTINGLLHGYCSNVFLKKRGGGVNFHFSQAGSPTVKYVLNNYDNSKTKQPPPSPLHTHTLTLNMQI